MKKIICSLALLLVTLATQAQTSNVILFTENGERFYVILNGLRQNEKPETNVKVTDLNATFYKLKIIFDNASLGEKNFNLGFNEGMETSFVIKKNGSGEYVLRPVSEVALAQAPPSLPTQTVVMYNTDGLGAIHTTTQQTTTTTTTNPNNGNVSMGMNVGDVGANVSVNVSGFDGGMQTSSSSSTTTTTTVTHTTTTNDYSSPPPPPPPPAYLPGYNGPIGCPAPMNPADFADLKNSIASKSFEDSKMTIAKQVLQNNCLFVSQVKDLMALFTFENTKLDFAKYAYDFTYDIGNYFKVNDQFTFESSIEDLNNYISGKKR
jgi:hypothetical protein